VNYHSWSGEEFKDHFAARWTGFVHIHTAGEYEFWTRSDDGSRLEVEGSVVVDNNGCHGMRSVAGKVHLDSGSHAIVLEYFQHLHGGAMQFSYKGPDSGNKLIIVPSSVFTHIPLEHRPPLVPTTCLDYKRVVLRLDLDNNGVVKVSNRKQFDENEHTDFNEASSYEICKGMEQIPLVSKSECSYGNRVGDDPSKPCLARLEQRTFKEASEMCSARGGRLVNFKSADELEAIRTFSSRRRSHLGLGLHLSVGGWKFDGSNDDATDVVTALKKQYGYDHFLNSGCVRLQPNDRLEQVGCHQKWDWICEGTLENKLHDDFNATGDLMADEGAFCLWQVKELRDELPNDETGFSNTDLSCPLQISSDEVSACAYNSTIDKLIQQRGHYSNKANYPVMGSSIGWTGSKAAVEFLTKEDAYSKFHCHYTPENSGFLRMYALQHMYERNYVGAMKRTCGCGYKHMANLVSRCDCTRNGRRSNNCATWHKRNLIRHTQSSPVRCNNCNSNENL
jgi:hypothetical protein